MKTINVEQLLFGYENGHKLLRSSLKSSLIQQKEVEILSDASGSGKFEDYISCFPLSLDGYYVFSKTWYADEMERPGCVWTHMLLIKFEDIDYLAGRIDVKSLFHRPNGDFDIYNNVISVNEKKVDVNTLNLYYIIYTLLYSEKSAIIESTKIEGFEDSLLSIITKLPSELLRKLSICTHSLHNRYINNQVFSYQITNLGNANKLIWDIENYIIYKKMNEIKEYPLWVKYISNLLLEERQSELYKYCKVYNCFDREFLKDFSKLLFFTKEFEVEYDLNEFLELTYKLEQGNIIREKTLELLFFENEMSIIKCFSENSVVTQLIHEMEVSEGILVKKKIDKVIAKSNAKMIYLEKDKKKIKNIFNKYIHGELNKAGNKVVSELIKVLKPSDLNKLFDMDINICEVLVGSDLRFLLCKDIWKQNRNFQLEMLSYARNREDMPVSDILSCIINNTQENISEEVYEIFQEDYVDFLYKYYKNVNKLSNTQILIWGHHLVLDKTKCKTIIGEINNGCLLVEIMKNINSNEITDEEEMEMWNKAIKNNIDYIFDNCKYESALFMLPIVLRCNNASDIIKNYVYDEIYKKLEKSEMDYNDWKRIEFLLPKVDIQQSWDKCLRLRLAFGK